MNDEDILLVAFLSIGVGAFVGLLMRPLLEVSVVALLLAVGFSSILAVHEDRYHPNVPFGFEPVLFAMLVLVLPFLTALTVTALGGAVSFGLAVVCGLFSVILVPIVIILVVFWPDVVSASYLHASN